MSLLTVVQRFCKRSGIASPSTVLGSTDPQVIQILGLLEEEGNDLSGRGDWQELMSEAIHITTASENQGDIKVIASNGFRYIVNGTVWDRTLHLPLFVMGKRYWQTIKSFSANGPRYHIRIRGGQLLSNPVPEAGHTWAFEYVSWNWISLTNGSRVQYFVNDTDDILLPEPIIMMGLRWRWKKEKGLSYEEDFSTYEAMVKDALGREGLKSTLDMGCSTLSGSLIDGGEWPL